MGEIPRHHSMKRNFIRRAMTAGESYQVIGRAIRYGSRDMHEHGKMGKLKDIPKPEGIIVPETPKIHTVIYNSMPDFIR